MTVVDKVLAVQQGAPVLAQWTTRKGLRVQYIARRSLPIVDVNIDFEAGSCFDPPGKAGVSEMVASLLLTGQKRYGILPAMNEEQAEHAFDEIGAKVAAEAQADRISVSMRSLSLPALLAHAWTLLSAMLLVPTWTARPFERERERLLAFAEEQLSDPGELCNLRMTQALYRGHPFGVVADETSINALTRDDVMAFHQRYLVRSRAILTLVGDVSQEAAERLAEQLSDALPDAPAETGNGEVDAGAPALSLAASLALSDMRIVIPHPVSQAHLAIATRVPGVSDPGYFPLMLANRMFSWRLNDVVRDRMGLAYEVSSALFMSRLGEHRIGLKTRGDQASLALEAVSRTLASFAADTDEAEFLRTRNELIEGRALALDSNAKLLRHAADIGFDHLPADYLRRWPERVAAVTREDALAAFAQWVNPSRQITVLLEPDAAPEPV